MNNKVVYAYFDNQECFYIGIGSERRSTQVAKGSRNKVTFNKIQQAQSKNTFTIQVLHSNLNWKMACWYERMYIQAIGRIDLGTGTLTNRTKGGEGVKGNVMSKESRNRISKAHKGKTISEEMRSKLRKNSRNKVKVKTPYGIFESLSEATEADQQVQSQTGVRYRCLNPKCLDYQYLSKNCEPIYKHSKQDKRGTIGKHIMTPKGEFSTLKMAALNYDTNSVNIMRRCKSKTNKLFYYI